MGVARSCNEHSQQGVSQTGHLHFAVKFDVDVEVFLCPGELNKWRRGGASKIVNMAHNTTPTQTIRIRVYFKRPRDIGQLLTYSKCSSKRTPSGVGRWE